MRYWSVDLCFSDPEGQTAQTCPKRLRGRQAQQWGGDRQWTAESVTNSGWSSAWHHCFVSEELAWSQPAAERGVCAVPTTWVVFFMNRMYWWSYSWFLHVSLSLCVWHLCDNSQALWFPLLEAMMSPQKLLKGANAKHTSDGETQTHKHSFWVYLLQYSSGPQPL